MTFLYFAYGSNMLTQRLAANKRCPSARPVGVAYADGYALEFSKRSNKDGSGKGSLIKASGERAYGVLFEIEDGELAALDREEGNGYGYRREDGFAVRRAGTHEEVATRTYIATVRDTTLRPFDWYLALIVAGARQNAVPPDEIERLLAVSYDVDARHDRERRQDAIEALALAGMGMPADVLG